MSNEEFCYSSKKLLPKNEDRLIKGFLIIDKKPTIDSYFEDKKLLDFFDYIDKYTDANFGNSQVFSITKFFIDHHFEDVLFKLTRYFSQIWEVILRKKDAYLLAINKSKTDLLLHSQSVLNFLLGYSRYLILKFYDNGSLKDLACFLKSKYFVDRFLNEKPLELILMNLSLIRKEIDSHKLEWIEADVVDSLLYIAERNEKLKPIAYSIILYAATDHQISKITDFYKLVSFYIDFIKHIAADIDLFGDKLRREKVGFYYEQKIKDFYIYCLPDKKGDVWDTSNFIETLYRVSVNDKIRYEMFFMLNLRDPLRIIIMKGTELEKYLALKLLAQLCFDSRVGKIVLNDNELFDFIKKLSTDETLSLKAITETCKKILWILSDENKRHFEPEFQTTTPKTQIMISYNAETIGLCLKIKNELEKAGYKVRIDINEINRSSLDSMANAIETSQIILLCINEKYRQSINCQLEAKYSMKCKKPIIPLIMQKGYDDVGGWLKPFMDVNINVDFTKYNFDFAMSKLFVQISNIGCGNNSNIETKKTISEKFQSENEDLSTSSNQIYFFSAIDEHEEDRSLEIVETMSTSSSESFYFDPDTVEVYETPETVLNKQQRVNNNGVTSIGSSNSKQEKVITLYSFKLSNNVIHWNDDQTRLWFESEGNKNLYNQIKPCNGEFLRQLHELQNESPVLFQEYLSNEIKADPTSIALFSKSLNKLFKKISEQN